MGTNAGLTIVLGKLVSWLSKLFRVGAGATWPGEVALRFNPYILSSFASQFRKGIILVAGTNGKTTTSLMIKTILEAQGLSVVHNASGANLLNGIVSACIQQAQWTGKLHADYGVFEVDENALPAVLDRCHSGLRAGIHDLKTGSRVKPGMTKAMVVVLLNLFRDQLDRYGEVDVIAEKWERAIRGSNATVIANSDDPLVAHLGLQQKATFFGVNDKTKFLSKMEHATDSIFCLNCGSRLKYEGIYFSHLGIWSCTKCGEKRPKPNVSSATSPLPGLYNLYNTLAAISVAKIFGINVNLTGFHPAFGRQEEIGDVKIFLSKNPAGFNESIRTVIQLGAKQLLFVLNDRIPDGRDVSWIWDVDFELLNEDKHVITVSGDRAYDLALRLKYGGISLNDKQIFTNLGQAITTALSMVKSEKTFYILATYSAMLEVRKILKGRKIL